MKKKYKKIICIITHKGSADRLKAIKETWLLKPLPPDYLVLFVYGNDGGVVPRLEGQNLYLESQESWANLPNKMYDLYKYCCENFNFDYLFKIDDDVYIHSRMLEQYPQKQIDYGGYFQTVDSSDETILYNMQYGMNFHGVGQLYKGAFPQRYAGGAVYLLSRKAVSGFLSFPRESLEDCKMEVGHEDLMIGKCMEQLNLTNIGHIEFDDWKTKKFWQSFTTPNYRCDLSGKQICFQHRIRMLWYPHFVINRLRSLLKLRTRIKNLFKH